jgi:hypothetical protein
MENENQDQIISEEDADQQQQQRYYFLVKLFCAFVLLFIVAVVSVVLIVALSTPTKLEEATLSHPYGPTVLVTETKSDFEQIMQTGKGWVGALLRGDPGKIEQDIYQLNDLLASGRAWEIRSGTKCLIIERDRSIYKVRIIESSGGDLTCWVHKNCVQR